MSRKSSSPNEGVNRSASTVSVSPNNQSTKSKPNHPRISPGSPPQNQSKENQPKARCPVCACPVGTESKRCPQCDTPHHTDCWQYAEGCAIYGCDSSKWHLPIREHGNEQIQAQLTQWASFERKACVLNFVFLSSLSFGIPVLCPYILLMTDTATRMYHPFLPIALLWMILQTALLVAVIFHASRIGIYRNRLKRTFKAPPFLRGDVAKKVSKRLRKTTQISYLDESSLLLCLCIIGNLILRSLMATWSSMISFLIILSVIGLSIVDFAYYVTRWRMCSVQAVVNQIEASLNAVAEKKR